MNAFVKKEIRLLLPGWLTVLALVILSPWASPDPESRFVLAVAALFIGMVMLGITSFGREFSQGTFPALLAQPVERRTIWRTKIGVLFSAVTLILIVHFLNAELILRTILENIPWSSASPSLIWNNFWWVIPTSFAVTLVAISGGLWTALLLRQIVSALWITFLTPLGIMMMLAFFLPAKLADNEHVFLSLIYSLTVLYAVFGFKLAHRLFYSAQDAGWTGGVISFSNWRYLEQRSQNRVSRRQWSPWAALVKKEFQLHSVSLFCAGALLVLHISMFFLRAFYADSHKYSATYALSQGFWMFWLVMPLVIGCTAVAEERKLGVMDEQFCLPISRRLEFLVKFIPTLIFGTLLGGVMPFVLELAAAHCGAPNEMVKLDYQYGSSPTSPYIVLASFFLIASAAMAWAAFYASTLAKNFLQALSVAIVIVFVGFFVFQSLVHSPFLAEGFYSFGRVTVGASMLILVGVPTILAALFWLCFRNFSQPVEPARLWRRNLLTIVGVMLFVPICSVAIYNRVWEIVEPAEPAHGPAVLSLSNPPVLKISGSGNISIRLPDGRLWIDLLAFKPGFSWANLPATLHSAGPRQFMTGSNWVAIVSKNFDFWYEDDQHGSTSPTHYTGYVESVGIQKNGTLWVSEKTNPKNWANDKLVRFGSETNWQQMSLPYLSSRVLLLKNDGTLWSWGTNYDWRSSLWPGLRTFKPRQIGADSDWVELHLHQAQKKDGSVWDIGRSDDLQPETNYDRISLQKLSRSNFGDLSSYIRPDGSLWAIDEGNFERGVQNFGKRQIGTETNWVTSVTTWRRIFALKSDGTLWESIFARYPSDSKHHNSPPARLGIHNDWVAIAALDNGVITLAADGSLWFWRDQDVSLHLLMKPPKQPQFLANIFN
jgi:ABC-type transport system involved in multi-copper enzyme maturation permease subunit